MGTIVGLRGTMTANDVLTVGGAGFITLLRPLDEDVNFRNERNLFFSLWVRRLDTCGMCASR
jgi:hypothetical protein